MPKELNKRHPSKEENHYQRKRDKEYKKLPSEFQPQSRPDFTRKNGWWIAILLMTTCLQAVRADGNSAPEQDESLEVEVLPPSSAVDMLSILAAKPAENICEGAVVVGAANITVQCAPKAKLAYARNPALYREDVASLNKMMGVITAQSKKVRCKFEVSSQDRRFHVQFATQEEITKKVSEQISEAAIPVAMYEGDPRAIIMPMGMRYSFYAQKTLQHELHHRHVAYRNEKLGRHNLEVLITPCVDLADPAPLLEMINNGLQRIQDYLLLIDAQEKGQKVSIHTREHKRDVAQYGKLSVSDKRKIEQLRRLTKNYEPAVYKTHMFMHEVQGYISEGFVSKDFQVEEVFSFIAPRSRIAIYVTDFEKITSSKPKAFRAITRTVPDITAENRMKAALLDGFYSVVGIAAKYAGDVCRVQIAEADAYLHETYEEYPELFEHLFPELCQFHKAEDADILGPCLSLIP